MKKIICLVNLLILLTPTFVSAEVAGEGLSLKQALEVAFVKNPRMAEARKEISASKGRWIDAEALPDPQAQIEIGGLKKNQNGERDGKIERFSISQPLDPLGTRFLKGRIAYDGVKIEKDTLVMTWSETALQVTETYTRILAEEKAFEAAEQNLKTSREFFTQIDSKFKSGSALRSEVLRANIEASKAENELLISQKNLKVYKGELNLQLGNPADEPINVSDALSYEPLQYEYKNLIEKALSGRPDLKIEKVKLSSRKKGLWSERLKGIFPRMSLGVERTTTDYENDTALLVSASYPLWGFNFGKIKEAKAEKEKQEIRLNALRKEINLEVYKAFLEAELADKQVLLHKKSLDEANELLRQMSLQYEEGVIVFLGYLENIKTIKETRLAYARSLKDFKDKVTTLEKAIQIIQPPEGKKLL